jgi:predicted ferric reductase
MYRVHKWLGIAALLLMVGHDTIDPDLKGAVRETWLGGFAKDLGELALNGFIGLILLSWFKRIPFTRLELPWPVWRFTHRFTGVLFAVVVVHQLAVDKPDGLDPSLGLYLNILSLAGLAAWLFTQLIAPYQRQRQLVIEHISNRGSVCEITLRAEGRAVGWRAGQFVFASAPEAGMREPHPFTIASAPRDDGRLTLCIKGLGRWTKRLPAQLHVGQRMRVEGPYGRFLFRERAQRQVWVAGGIGITPFLAWAEALQSNGTQQIALFWAVSKGTDAFAADRLRALAALHPRLNVHIIASDAGERLTAQLLAHLTPFHLSNSELYFCGPRGLRDAIVSGLKDMGQAPRRIHHEAFALR